MLTTLAFAALLLGAPSPPFTTMGVTADAIVWTKAPPSLPAGAQAAVLEGDPTKPGLVTMRLRIPHGYRLPEHTHPADERVTVLQGAMRVWTPARARLFPAGSFYVTPMGVKHSVAAEGETIIQITVQGPWGVTYVNASDDPRSAEKR